MIIWQKSHWRTTDCTRPPRMSSSYCTQTCSSSFWSHQTAPATTTPTPQSPPQTGRLMKRWTTSVAPTSEHCCSVLSLSSSQWLIQSSPRQGWYAYSWERDSWVSDQLINQYCPATNTGATRCVPGWNRQDYCFVKAVMSACWGRTIISHYLHSLQSYLRQIHCLLRSFFFFFKWFVWSHLNLWPRKMSLHSPFKACIWALLKLHVVTFIVTK